MENEKILRDYSNAEKGAYLGAIASIATADRQATEEEMEYLDALADTAGLSDEQKEAVSQIAQGISPDDLKQCLDVLKDSDLRYSLITDIIAFAKSDANYSDTEKNNIDKIAQYLGVNEQQVSALHQFVNKAAESRQSPEGVSQHGFLDSLGLGNVFNNSGLTKNILGVAGPMLLGALLSRGLSGRHGGGGLGGMLGSAGGMLGGGGGSMLNGGLGGLFSMLSGGRGFNNSGGLLSGIFGR
ncbi:MAG TPA: TerB family tellurite resistance protein [Parafilimonas sp.]|nr:TerB family tellurite resistance protein [Parafilimonas sp.]